MILAPHQGSIILQREKKNKDIRGTFLILRLTNRQFKRSPTLRSIHHQGYPHLPHPPTSGSERHRGGGQGGVGGRLGFCALSALRWKQERKGHQHQGLEQTSGQLQQSAVTSGACLISQQTSPKPLGWELMSATPR